MTERIQTDAMDFTPAARAVPRPTAIRAQFRTELRNTVRNWEQVLLLAIVPAAVAVYGITATSLTSPIRIATVIAFLGSGFTSVAVATAFERRYGVLRALAMTPLSRTDLVTAKAMSAVAVALLQLSLLAGVGLVLGEALHFRMLLALLAGMSALVPWALLLAMRLSAEKVLAIANAMFLALAIATPATFQGSVLIPSAAMRVLMTPQDAMAIPLAVLLVFAAAGTVLVHRLARWSE
jgi:ABC-2 type transport system permease protein